MGKEINKLLMSHNMRVSKSVSEYFLKSRHFGMFELSIVLVYNFHIYLFYFPISSSLGRQSI